MNCREIIIAHLKSIGAGGLCHVHEINGVDCGCSFTDFIPCGSDPSECVPAKVYVLPESDRMADHEKVLAEEFGLIPGDEYYTPLVTE